MGIENTNNFRQQRLQTIGGSSKGQTMTYSSAKEFIKKQLSETKSIEIESKVEKDGETIKKTKTYLQARKNEYRDAIRTIVQTGGFRVAEYGDRMDQFIEEMVESSVGYDILADAMYDDEVSDIFIINWDKIYVEKNGENVKYHKSFASEDDFQKFTTRILGEAGKEINGGDKKIVDFEIFGDRGSAIDKSVSPNGTSITLRKHSDDHITRNQLVDWGVLTEEMADFLGMLIQGESNIVCAGLTGSGKTTTLRALLDHYVPIVNKRMLVCEDTQELFPTNDHTLELISTSKTNEEDGDITLNDLILTALRQKPKYIIVGEVRGAEAEAAVEAMETGHSTMFTMHGGKIWNVINRLVTKFITSMPSLGKDVVERIIGSSVDYIFIQSNIPNIGRKVTEIVEINYDYKNNYITTKTIFKFDLKKQEWIKMRGISSDKADKIMERGVPIAEAEKWIEKTESVSSDVEIIPTLPLIDFQLKLVELTSDDKEELLGILSRQISIININLYNFAEKVNYDVIEAIKSQVSNLLESVIYANYLGFEIGEILDSELDKLKNSLDELCDSKDVIDDDDIMLSDAS